MRTARFLAKRASEYLAIWLVAITFDFFIPRAAPILAVHTPSGQLTRILGTQGPLYEQYLRFLWNLLHMNLGISLWLYGTPVAYLVARALQYDVVLLVPALLISWYLGDRLGIYLGTSKRNVAIEKIAVPLLYAVSSAPYFWWAMLFTNVLSSIGLSPPTGVTYSLIPSASLLYIADFLRHLALPLATLIFVMTGMWTLNARESVISELRSYYVLYEEMLGFEDSIMRRHVDKNSRGPLLTYLAISLGLVASGSYILEAVLGYPGIGVLLYNAISNYDYVLIQGIFSVVITLILVLNFAIDVLLVALDPRMRLTS